MLSPGSIHRKRDISFICMLVPSVKSALVNNNSDASLPSEYISSGVHDHQGEPGIDNTPDREGPASWGDVCLIASRHITCGGMEGTWKTTDTLMRLRSNTDWQGLALSWCSTSSQRRWMGQRSGLCAGQSSSSTSNWENHFFMKLALSCINRTWPQTVASRLQAKLLFKRTLCCRIKIFFHWNHN